MQFKSAVVLVLVSTFLFVSTADKTFNSNGVYVKVLQKGATVVASRSENIDADNKKVTVTFLELSEVNTADGAAIADKTVDLSVNFTLTDPAVETIGSLNADVITATLSGKPTVEIKIYIFKVDGELDFGGEKTNVLTGDVKFNVKISDYTFSADPTTTEFQFKVKVKGSSSPAKGSTDLAYSLGGGSTLKLSKKVSKDSTYEDMRETFPKLEGDTFIFRFPKFTTSVIYDPVIRLGLPAEMMFNAEGVYVKLIRKTGAISIARSKNIDADANKVMLTLAHVRKTNSSGDILDQSTFDAVTFPFVAIKDVNISKPEILASMTAASATVLGGTLEIKVYLFKQKGVITQDTEKTSVEKGDFKLEFKLSGYTLGTGNQLEVVVVIKGPDATPTLITGDATGIDGKAYELGKKSKLFLSTKIKIDTDFKNITKDYPKLEQKPGASFVFRFPNFDGKSLTYDPIIRLSKPDVKPGSATTHMFNIFLVLFSLLLSQMFY